MIISIYTLKGIKGKNAIKIKHLETGKINSNEKIKDTSIYKFEVAKNILCEVFACNITNASLISSKTQPMLYATVALAKPFKTAILCNIILKFTIKDEIKSREQLLKSELHGTFSLDLYKDAKSIPLDKTIDVFPGEDKMLDLLENFIKTESMTEILKEMADIEEEKIAQRYKDENNYFNKIPKATIKLSDYVDKNLLDK